MEAYEGGHEWRRPACSYRLGLRVASKYWKQIYNDEVTSYEVDARRLHHHGHATYIMGLTQLHDFVIRGTCHWFHPETVKRSFLGAMTASLRKLELNAASNQLGDSGEESRLIVEDFAQVLLAWRHSLQCLVVYKCELRPSDAYALDQLGYFSMFPELATLELNDLECSEEPLPTIDLYGCKALEALMCCSNHFKTLDVTSCRALSKLNCSNNALTNLDLSYSTKLMTLKVTVNQLTSIDVSACSKLELFAFDDNCLSSINLLACAGLKQLHCQNNVLVALNMSASSALQVLHCSNNKLSSLSLPSCTNLTALLCNNNQLTTLDLSACPSLKALECDGNSLYQITFAPHACLDRLRCVGNEADLIVQGGAIVFKIECDASIFGSLAPTMRAKLQKVILHGPVTEELSGFESLQKLKCSVTATGLISLNGCVKVELDCECMTETLMVSGRANVHSLTLTGLLGLSDLIGFTKLEWLDYDLEHLEILDLSVCTAITSVHVRNSQGLNVSPLLSINLTGCLLLQSLHCDCCPYLIELDVSTCASLEDLSCIGSGVSSLDVSMCPKLCSLNVTECRLLEALNTTNCTKLRSTYSGGCPKLASSNG